MMFFKTFTVAVVLVLPSLIRMEYKSVKTVKPDVYKRQDIYNVDGKLVHSGQNIFGRNEVSVPTGNYGVKVTGENGKNFSLKITVL